MDIYSPFPYEYSGWTRVPRPAKRVARHASDGRFDGFRLCALSTIRFKDSIYCDCGWHSPHTYSPTRISREELRARRLTDGIGDTHTHSNWDKKTKPTGHKSRGRGALMFMCAVDMDLDSARVHLRPSQSASMPS